MQRGKFIVLQGLDRSGKSTMVSVLQQKMSQNEEKAVSIGFPIRTSPTGIMINDFLTNKVEINHETLHLLFSANRWEAVKEIEEKLRDGINIICDRYWYSGVAYSFAKGLNLQWCMAPDQGLIKPDLIIYLKGDPIKLAQRSGYGNQRYQKVEFQTKVAQCFDKLFFDKLVNKQRIETIEITDKNLEQVRKQVQAVVALN